MGLRRARSILLISAAFIRYTSIGMVPSNGCTSGIASTVGVSSGSYAETLIS